MPREVACMSNAPSRSIITHFFFASYESKSEVKTSKFIVGFSCRKDEAAALDWRSSVPLRWTCHMNSYKLRAHEKKYFTSW